MQRFKTFGSCLVVVLALSGLASASASALPEFSGSIPGTFTSTSGKSVLETAVSKAKVKCTADTGFGEITGGQTGMMQMLFSGCSLKSISCHTPGVVPGDIATALLSMKVGYINKANKEVGIDLATATGAPFMEFVCGTTLRGIVTGSVIGIVTPVNKAVSSPKTFKLTFAQKKGIQAIPNLEGGLPDVLETILTGPTELSGLKSTDQITIAGTVELKA